MNSNERLMYEIKEGLNLLADLMEAQGEQCSQKVADAYVVISRAMAVWHRSDYNQWAECAPYLKDGESPAQCIARNRADMLNLAQQLANERKIREQLCQALEYYYSGEDGPSPAEKALKLAKGLP